MKKLSLLIFAAAAFAVSCKNSKTTESQAKTEKEAVADLPANTATERETATDQSAQTAVAAKADAGQKPALNPAHGEPYHRCDIQVGAPIDSPAPAQNTAPQVVQQSPANGGFNTNPISPSAAPAPTVSSTAASGPKPALNPAHGEPHHRCDLQVGAPLI